MKKTLLFLIIFVIILIGLPLLAKGQVTIPNPLNNINTPQDLIKAISDILVVLAIPLATALIIISGIQYLTSAGNQARLEKAKKTILYSLVGLAIVLAANFIIDIISEILGGISET